MNDNSDRAAPESDPNPGEPKRLSSRGKAGEDEPESKLSFLISRTLFFQILLAVTSGSVGLPRLFHEDQWSLLPAASMLALPVAAAIVAGGLTREILEKPRPSLAAAISLPIMHGAILLCLSSLVGIRYTSIEAPTGSNPAMMWTESNMLMISMAAQSAVAGVSLWAIRGRAGRLQAVP